MKLFLLIIIGAYLLVCLAAFLFQSRFVFFPSSEHAGTPGDAGLSFEDVTLENGAGTKIHGWFIPAANPRFTLLFCHGNAGNITHRIESIQIFNRLNLSVFIFDYSGYGRSGGRPSERATYLDSRAAWDYLTGEKKLKRENIILFGRSLGAAVAIELATEVDPCALILESAFTSAVELGARVYPWLPVRLMSRIRYNSMSRIQDVRTPKLFIHSIEDEVVPFGMGRRLYNRAARPKTLVKIRGGHNDGFVVSGPEYVQAIGNFLDGLETRGDGRFGKKHRGR